MDDHHRSYDAEEIGPGQWSHRHVHQHEAWWNWHHNPGPPFEGRFDDHEHFHWRRDGDPHADHHDPAADHPGHVHVRYADGVSADHPTDI